MKKYNKLDGFYIEEDEKFLIKHMLPEYFIYQNLNKGNVDFVLNFLQNELNAILNSFVNGGFSYKGFVLYPFIKDVSKENRKKIEMLKKIAIFLNDNGYDFSDNIKKYGENINSNNFATVLSSFYQDFSSIKIKNTKLTKKPACDELDMASYKKADLEYLRSLNDLKNYANNYLKQYLSGFYLHGSLATKDYIKGWSDVDTLAVISKETIENPKRLLMLRDKIYHMRYLFYRVDPLQHHGSIIISEYDLDNYCQAYFPVPIFKYAKSLFKEDMVNKFAIRDFSSEALNRLFWFVNYFRKLNIEKKFNLGSYDVKNLLHCITLFPTTYLQAKGVLVYKKFSFDIAKKDFKKDSWGVIGNVSDIRSNWKDFDTMPLIGLTSKTNPLLYYQLNSRIIDLFKDIKKTNNIDIKKLIESMFKLSEEAWSKVKENAKDKRV